MLTSILAENPGVFRKVGRFFGGASEKEKKVEKAERNEWMEAKEKKTKELLEQRQKSIEANQEHALKALEKARLTATERQQALDKTSLKFKKVSDDLLESSKSLENANAILGQLGHEKVDLVSTTQQLDSTVLC
jgi:hypothetical protein